MIFVVHAHYVFYTYWNLPWGGGGGSRIINLGDLSLL